MPHPVSLRRTAAVAVAAASASALALTVSALGAAHARVQTPATADQRIEQPLTQRPVVAPGAVDRL